MTIYDGMVGPWFLPTFLEHADVETVHYAVLMPSLDVCLSRVLGREEHGFRDEAATRQMHAAFADAGIDGRHVIEGGQEAPSEVVRALLERFERGELVPS